ncbi:hypothetical protein T09_3019 [Trichinella sp. T9]|nr:hypothetical protein T09_3019 [Trichinella sp. T9]
MNTSELKKETTEKKHAQKQQSIDRMENLTVKLKTVENRNMKAAYAKQSKQASRQAARRPGRQASQHDQRCSFINVA